jgi:hypothetical protein
VVGRFFFQVFAVSWVLAVSGFFVFLILFIFCLFLSIFKQILNLLKFQISNSSKFRSLANFESKQISNLKHFENFNFFCPNSNFVQIYFLFKLKFEKMALNPWMLGFELESPLTCTGVTSTGLEIE